ncbi:MAG: 3-oxoacyl-[acyl-carrier-protein] reductase [Holosporaceae bacterium]|jgi:3-oxoacyl-[acyl-carrier protein] reductase|nr:3-oxoacyl-[acyl-carrier-protein] reductase [Holosporaceae bacterium]
MFDLSGKVALVTGASGAIGSAIVKTLHKMGATVAASGTRMDALEILADELAERIHIFGCDLRSSDAVEELVPAVIKICGHLDILVNNAGITRDDLLMRMGDDSWNDVMSVNLEAPFRLMRAACRNMVKSRWGRIVNISSIVGAVGNAGQTNYSATKSGLFGLSKSAALELASRNITVNCIAPGFIASPMVEQIPEPQRERLMKSIPLGRVGEPAEVAAAVAFLSTAEASYITGHVLQVNGGMAMI